MTDDSKNPYRSPATGTTVGRSVDSSEGRLRVVLVVAMYLFIAIGNAIVVLRPDARMGRLIFSIAIASIMTYWCVVDSHLRRARIVNSLHWIIFFTWPVAVPIYLIWSRGVRGLGLVLVHGIGLFVTCLVAYHLMGYLVYGAEWVDLCS